MAAREVVFDRGGALSTIDGILKDHYVLEQIQDQVNKSTVFLSRLRTETSTHGRKFIFPVKLGVSQGVGARGENQPIPDAGFGEYDQAFGNVKYLYSTLTITGQSIEATRGSRQAFADALKQALSDAREGMRLDMQRQVWGQSSGAIGAVAGAQVSGITNVPVGRPYGLTYAGVLDNSQKVRLFKRNMRLVIDAATPQYVTVQSVNSDGTITLTAATTAALADGDLIYRADSNATGDASKGNEITGLAEAVSATGTYFGIARAGTPEWQSNLVDAAGALSEAKMRIAMDQSEIHGLGEPDLIITDHVNRRRYEALLQGLKRFPNSLELGGGFTAIEFDGKPMIVDKDAPPERMWFLRTGDFTWMQMAPISWIDRDGAVLNRVSGYDKYEATLYTYRELVCKKPVNQTVLYGITS